MKGHHKGQTINYGSQGSNESMGGSLNFGTSFLGGITQFKSPVMGDHQIIIMEGITGSKYI